MVINHNMGDKDSFKHLRFYLFPCEAEVIQVAQAYQMERGFIWFDSARDGHPQNKYSLILWSPKFIRTFKDQAAFSTTSFPFFGLDTPANIAEKSIQDYASFPLPFYGGWAGYWGYELGFKLDRILKNAAPIKIPYPLSRFGFYIHFFIHCHTSQQSYFCIHACNKIEAEREFLTFQTTISKLPRKYNFLRCSPLSWQSNFSPDEYLKTLESVINLIFEGELFQANIAQQFLAHTQLDFDPFDAYLKLRYINPAPFAAYLNWGNYQILSSSPESFLEVGSEGHAITRPIKGTASSSDELQNSEKDLAENLMIVDLMRNDFSKICTVNSVEVSKLFDTQQFAGLYHLVSEVSGTLRSTTHPLELLKACFPGGSITGAPKIRAMQIIHDFEKSPRGVYCGTIGWLDATLNFQANIAIRTLIYHNQLLSFGVGGGITACSKPEYEYMETLLKAQKIFEAFKL